MSKEEILLELVLDKFSNIKEVLNATKDIENFLINLKLNKKEGVGVILEKTKALIDSLYDHSVKVKEEFYDQYKALESLSEEKNEDCESSIEEASVNEPCPHTENVNSETENQAQENVTNICAEEQTEPRTEHSVEDEGNKNNIDENIDREVDDIVDESHLNNLEEDPLKDSESSAIIESSIVEEDNIVNEKESPPKTESIEVKPNCQSLIRLVDLSKLIDPKQKKSVKFDSSIIILTSSDEETPIKTPKKINEGKDEIINLKSALKNTSTPNIKDTKAKNTHKVNGSDCSEIPVKTILSKGSSKQRPSSEDSDSDEAAIENTRKKNKSKEKEHRKRLSFDSDIYEVENTTKKNNNKEKSDKNSESDNSSETESANKEIEKTSSKNPRKSSRIQNNQTSKLKEREHLKKIFKRIPARSTSSNRETQKQRQYDGSGDSELDTTTKRRTFKKKNRLVEERLSDTSSLSSSDTDINITKENLKAGKGIKKSNSVKTSTCVDADEKFKWEVHVPLPRIECSRLKEIYLKNKEILEIKRLTNIDSLTTQKRSRTIKNDDKSSSEGEKPQSKKSRKDASDKKLSPEDDSSSDDEPLNKLQQSTSAQDTVNQENTGDKDEIMADIAMNELDKSDNREKSVSSDSDVENNQEEKRAKKNDTDRNKNSDENEDGKNDDAKEKSDEDTDKTKEDQEKKNSSDSENDNKEENKDSSDSDSRSKTSNKKRWRRDKLLTSRIDSTDSEEELKKCASKRNEPKSDSARKVRKRIRKPVVSSDSEGSGKNKNDDSASGKNSESSDEKNSDDSDKEVVEKKPARKRIRRTKDSSSSEEDKSTRKNIRRVIDRDSLSETTKKAEAEEKERKARILEKQKKYNKLFELTAESKVDKVVLDYDEKEKKELLSVNKKIVKKLKPHQASGVQFMWDACFESLDRAKTTKGSGCILAHCMGLGKTLQVIALSHTLLMNDEDTKVNKILVVCPLNTVLNWKNEFNKWMPKTDEFEVYELVSSKQMYEKQYVVNEWHTEGGVLIIGYDMFRNLTNPTNKRLSKKMRKTFYEGLVDPGADLVVCDEGHLLKNEKTHLSVAMNRIRTMRRIVLTGTPLQNNLKEYWCMVQFIKPNLLGTYREYLNRFVNPITNGQYTDSTQHDIILMRKRSHVLHKLLDGVVQRRDYSVLEPYLPPKYEYVLFVKLTETQVNLYKHYMEKFARKSDMSSRTSFLFTDFQELQRICTHPRVLLDRSNERREKELDEEDSEGSLKDFIDDGEQTSEQSSSSSSGSGSGSEDSDQEKKAKAKGKQQKVRVTRAQAAQRRENNEESDPEVEELQKEWFQQYCDGEELDNINNSGKLFLLFQILKECEEIGDKVLVFSQSLYTLNCIEYFLEKIDEATQKGCTEKVGGHSGSWAIGLDYFRLDGSSSCDNRAIWCNMFNNPDNTRARLFLISTKAGGLGINLVAANRVIIFDVSWNPSHDIQSIYRVYRFGQTKPCYIYRFVSYGTMEMKIYERQVTKQAISKRVIDEQQIDRHYNQNDLQELYRCDLEPTDRPIPMVPKDVLLGEMLQKYENTIFKYHLHQSLLENKEDEGLNEEERKAAWEEFENEKVLRQNTGLYMGSNVKVNAQAIELALANIVRKDNPTWSDVQVKGIIPALVQQLQVQLSEGDTSMYARVQQEIQLMQEIQAQKFREACYQQQVMRMIQRQQQQAKLMGNLHIDPSTIGNAFGNSFTNNMNRGGPSTAPSFSNDVIELND